jgi:hypothetical protein
MPDNARVSLDRVEGLLARHALGNVPELDPPVLTTTDEQSGIATKCDARDTALMGL